MKTAFYTAIIASLACWAFVLPQDSKTPDKKKLCVRWRFNDTYYFPAKMLRLGRCAEPQKASRDSAVYCYSFSSSGSFKLQMYDRGKLVPDRYPAKISAWKIKGDTLNIHLAGTETESSYEYDVDYRIGKLTDDSLVLKSVRENVIKRRSEAK